MEQVLTEQEIRIWEIKFQLEELTKDFAQEQAGLVIDNMDEKKQQFRDLHTELRGLLGKEPRKIKSFDKVE